jgi:arylsulfatase A-like enzyme
VSAVPRGTQRAVAIGAAPLYTAAVIPRRDLARFSLLALAAVCGCAREPAAPRNLVLITIDTLRSDRVGAYGNPRVRTPHLDRLAAQGVLFQNATSQIPSTLPSHASILTGRYPTSHGVHDNGVYFLDARESTLAEMLAELGFDTAGFVSAFVLDRRFGIDQGFAAYGDTMDTPLRAGSAPEIEERAGPVASWWVSTWFGAYQRRGARTIDEALAWLGARRAAAAQPAPFFLWVHLFDPHEPYDAPAPLATMYDRAYAGAMDGSGETFHAERVAGRATARDVEHMRARYDAEVTYADRCVGTLLDSLAAWNLDGNTLVAVTADHGEGMGEHDYYFEHGSELWEPLLNIPLVLAGPGVPRGRVASTRVRSIDILPTVLECLGFPAPAAIDGASVRAAFGGEGVERSSYAETQCWLAAMPVMESLRAFSSGRWKLIAISSREPAAAAQPPRVLLFDLNADPGELRNVASDRPAVAQDLLERLAETARSEARDSVSVSTRAMDEETVSKLRALGYVQ